MATFWREGGAATHCVQSAAIHPPLVSLLPTYAHPNIHSMRLFQVMDPVFGEMGEKALPPLRTAIPLLLSLTALISFSDAISPGYYHPLQSSPPPSNDYRSRLGICQIPPRYF